MTYYTDSNQIKELMTQIADVEVNDLNALESLSGVTVYVLDNLFTLGLPETTVRSDSLLMRRPDWGGMILELMKKNEEVYLYWGEWCRVLYRSNLDDFRFIHCSNPIMAADRTCLIATQAITYAMRNAIQDLMEPIRFGQAMTDRLKGQSNDYKVKSLLTFNRGDYKEICLKMEELMSDVMHQRDMWKDRFFFKAIEENRNALCAACKEDMRQAFYVRGDEEAALKWRPGKANECWCSNCKIYSWESFEEEYHEDYIQDIKIEEFVSSDESD